MYIKPIKQKDINSIATEWDMISPQREALIRSGKDISFEQVLVPYILNEIQNCDLDWTVDCGCGTGTLTRLLASNAKKVSGIDISKISIEIANANNHNISNVDFSNISIEEYSQNHQGCISLCIANMVLINIIDLSIALEAINYMLKDNGYFIFTITHPCYWPIYWDYFKEPWFDYSKEIIIEAEFSTTLSKNIGISTHVHRPMNLYFELLKRGGFQIVDLKEPYPQSKHDNYKYLYPRFLCVKCRKI